MANRRVLLKRRKATTNIRKITRTMQLIATARFQTAYKAAVAGRPYTDKLAELVSRIANAAEGIDHPLMKQPEAEKTALLMVLTSTRGLCGGYNANLLRTARQRLADLEQGVIAPRVQMVGKKGVSFFRFVGQAMEEEITHLGDLPRFDQVEPFANSMMERFLAGEIDSVSVAYTQFISTSKQQPVVEQLLPLQPPTEKAAGDGEDGKKSEVEFEFLPEPQELLNELLPATFRVRLFQCFTDAAVSEQIARMVAMKTATDAAEKMIRRLTQQYNRARQTQITMELLDIVGGANALA